MRIARCRRPLCLIVIFGIATSAYAQTEPRTEPVLLNPEEVRAAIRDNYPAPLWDIRASGQPILRVRVDESGEVERVDVIDSGGHRFFAAAAEEVAKAMRFEPARENGVPVESELEVPVDFEIPVPPELEGLDFSEGGANSYDTPPQLTNRQQIAQALTQFYPERMRRARTGGRVLLVLKIDSTGQVRSIEVHESSGILPIDEAALAVGAFMRFSPATVGGSPSPAVVSQWVTFAIR